MLMSKIAPDRDAYFLMFPMKYIDFACQSLLRKGEVPSPSGTVYSRVKCLGDYLLRSIMSEGHFAAGTLYSTCKTLIWCIAQLPKRKVHVPTQTEFQS